MGFRKMLARSGDCQLAESDCMVRYRRLRGRGGAQMERIAPGSVGGERGEGAYRQCKMA